LAAAKAIGAIAVQDPAPADQLAKAPPDAGGGDLTYLQMRLELDDA
jgi:hypothetical protein